MPFSELKHILVTVYRSLGNDEEVVTIFPFLDDYFSILLQIQRQSQAPKQLPLIPFADASSGTSTKAITSSFWSQTQRQSQAPKQSPLHSVADSAASQASKSKEKWANPVSSHLPV